MDLASSSASVGNNEVERYWGDICHSGAKESNNQAKASKWTDEGKGKSE
jgi:hypothetical protein